jgi:hypothetical protein
VHRPGVGLLLLTLAIGLIPWSFVVWRAAADDLGRNFDRVWISKASRERLRSPLLLQQ